MVELKETCGLYISSLGLKVGANAVCWATGTIISGTLPLDVRRMNLDVCSCYGKDKKDLLETAVLHTKLVGIKYRYFDTTNKNIRRYTISVQFNLS
jgi:hypothetical protein